jgi:hypothetical protein
VSEKEFLNGTLNCLLFANKHLIFMGNLFYTFLHHFYSNTSILYWPECEKSILQSFLSMF